MHTDGFILGLHYTQRAVVDEEASDFVRVKSGVPQGTVMINAIQKSLSRTTR